MTVLLAATALPCGLVIGLLLGALGGGGSILAVPALVYLMGQSPHGATAGALVVVTVGALGGLLCHARAGRVRWAAGTTFGALGTAGSYLGSRWSATLDADVLMAAFSGLMLVVAVGMLWRDGGGLRRRRGGAETGTETRTGTVATGSAEPVPLASQGERAAREGASEVQDRAQAVNSPSSAPSWPRRARSSPPPPRRARPLRTVVTASSVGLLTGFFGVGGGFVVVPALTLVLGLEMPVAVGTSLLVILINSAAALATRAGTGALDWPLLATLAACAAAGSHLGNRLAGRLRPQTLTASFAALVTVLALAMAATTLPHL
ncbi:sulfite exporter TauE/SafE family protein [Streptomyces sp. NPDC057743]|uniref:sulfite exporter TauE/SafE family protein n=1 Tax=Streptomyces sp. NPDC057743 TaxID=3346236 RepID=UPI0036C6DB67